MALVHLRVLCPREFTAAVTDALTSAAGSVAVTAAPVGPAAPDLDAVSADLAREAADGVLTRLHDLGVPRRGMIAMDPVATAIGTLARSAEEQARGAGDDALVWGELLERTGSESSLSWTYFAFMVLATILAAIGVVTDSPITIVGAMVIGPEFGPLAAVAVGLVRRRWSIVRPGLAALGLGFAAAIVLTALLSALARWVGLIQLSDITGSRQTEFIYHPGWFSLITALVAGTAGMLSLTSSKSAVLVGVFISVTTIPAAGNAAVAGVLGRWSETWWSMAQLGINLTGIVVAGVLTLLIRGRGRLDGGARRHTAFG